MREHGVRRTNRGQLTPGIKETVGSGSGCAHRNPGDARDSLNERTRELKFRRHHLRQRLLIAQLHLQRL